MNYAIIGLGYIAEKHLQAIKATGGNLLYAIDPYHTNGILDKYFLDCKFTRSYEIFELALETGDIDYVVICSPSAMHPKHINLAHSKGCKVICEKPIIITIRQLDDLDCYDDIYVIQQLRYSRNLRFIHPRKVDYTTEEIIKIKYHSPRGNWYRQSWKHLANMSGGLIMNIGVHLFDLMLYMYGSEHEPRNIELDFHDEQNARGSFKLGNIKIIWDLSISPKNEKCRMINGVDLSDAENLHEKAYNAILKGEGITLYESQKNIFLVSEYQELQGLLT